MPNLKVWTSTIFTLLLSAAFIAPAIAQLPQEQQEVEDNPRTGQQPGQPTIDANPDATPAAPTQNNPRSLQQNTQQRTTGQDLNTGEQTTGQETLQQDGTIRERTTLEETTRERRTVESQPATVETRPTFETQQQTTPTTTVEDTPPVRGLW